MRDHQTEVLIVGAGPVGLMAAVLLADAGIKVQIVDREERTAARSYACALHPSSLRLLERVGLAATVLQLGKRISRIAFYDGETRRAQLNLSELGGEFPFLLVLPQSALEGLLEQTLRQKFALAINWNHRFDGLQAGNDPDAVMATVEKLGGTAVGYIVPHWETVVMKRISIRAQFLLGADGHNSLVRQRLGIEYQRMAGPEFFAAIEFTSDTEADDELRIVLDEATTNILWPLPGNHWRWTFQLVHSEVSREFPEKERSSIRFTGGSIDDDIRSWVQSIARRRAPWFSASVEEITWCTQVAFEHRLVKRFGQDRCWLAGDAAHQTSPAGVQSLNAGLCEAAMLADALQRILREDAPLDLLGAYDQRRQEEWRRLLGLNDGVRTRVETDSWTRGRCARILPCLPVSGDDLTGLADQLALDIATDSSAANFIEAARRARVG